MSRYRTISWRGLLLRCYYDEPCGGRPITMPTEPPEGLAVQSVEVVEIEDHEQFLREFREEIQDDLERHYLTPISEAVAADLSAADT